MGKTTGLSLIVLAVSWAADTRCTAAFLPPHSLIPKSAAQTAFAPASSPAPAGIIDVESLHRASWRASRSHDALLYAYPPGDEEIPTSDSEPSSPSPIDPGREEKKSKASVARAGGRSRSGVPPRRNESELTKREVPGYVKLGAVVALLVLLLKSLLGGLLGGAGSAPSSYVYYQASMYESRTVGPDGRMETTRKESVRSNVPSLISGDRDDSSTARSSPPASFLLRESSDDEIDREIDDAIRRSMEFERSITRSLLDDFF
eukprot:CAMPEP_0197466752 /NCGR_PEP_ID=MMETSP1175-20131217/65216_1 /TAXON_ID=1003142 /ORGANISM="Triceratium dubium, Strain CCMP147" /LENGTH=260 /DNA_ID=CAMNT_0043002805 /DNA_START=109 /DNA_END=891 /DNA_ORIENTATION=+